MVEALQRFGIALAFATDHRAAMRAGVQQGIKLALGIARKDNLAARHPAGYEVALFRQFRLMAQIKPAPLEDFFLLGRQDFRIDEDAPGDIVGLAGFVDHD